MIPATSDTNRPNSQFTVPANIARHLDQVLLEVDVDAPIPFTIVPGVIA